MSGEALLVLSASRSVVVHLFGSVARPVLRPLLELHLITPLYKFSLTPQAAFAPLPLAVPRSSNYVPAVYK